MKLRFLPTAAILLSLLAPAARGTVLVYEGFHQADYGNKTGNNSTTASNGNTTGDHTVGVALGGWSANGTAQVLVTSPDYGLALPGAMTDAGFTAVGGAIGMNPSNNNTGMVAMYHNLMANALNVSSGTLYFRVLLAVDSKAAGKLVAGASLAEKSGGYYGFGFGVAPTSNNSYAPTQMKSTITFAIWKNSSNQYVLSLVHTTADGTTFTSYPIVTGLTVGSTYVCYAEVKFGAGTDGKELVRAGAMAAGDYATSVPWATLDGSSDTVEVDLISDSSYPTCMAVGGPYGMNGGRFRADEIAVGTKLGDVLYADGAFSVAPSGAPTIGLTTFTNDWRLIAGSGVTVDAEIVSSTDSSFATATTNSLGTGLAAGTRTASLTGLEPDTTYWWKISADKSGERNESVVQSFRTAGAPILVDVSATAVENAITFSAALAEAALGNTLDTTVSVFYGTDGSTWTELQLGTASSAQTYADTVSDLTFGTTYRWFVRAGATSGGRTFEDVSTTNSVTILHTGDTYVAAGAANAVAPYSTPETAAPNIATALGIATDGATIHVAPGLYPISSQIQVLAGVRIDGTDPSRTIVSNTVNSTNSKQQQRVFKINHADALVANLTMQNGSTYSWGVDGGNFLIESNGGTVSNCIVEASTQSQSNGHAAGGYLKAGLVTHTIFRGNRTRSSSANQASNRCGVMQLEGSAHAENCLFTDNRQTTAVTLINVYGTSVMRNCTIVDSGLSATNSYCKSWSALNIASGATVQNVVIAGVTNTVNGAACKPTGTCANFLNGALDSSIAGTTFPATTVVGTAAEFFPHYADNVPYEIKYRPKSGGLLADKGADYEPMALYDLSGTQKRKIGSHVDIGCYEANGAGTMLLVR